MDVLRLNPTTFLADEIIEGYSSMIWTERYLSNGEFEMHTADIAKTRALIPEDSLICLRDSPEVMIVETHEIDSKGELVVRGRTFETFLEHRGIFGTPYKTPWKTYRQYTTPEAVAALIWNYLVNTSGKDVTRQNYDILTQLAVPNVVVTDSSVITPAEAVRDWWLEEGEVYKFVTDFLGLAKLGVRNIRPISTTGNVMTFNTSTTAGVHGTATKTTTTNIDKLRLDIYNGLDRTKNQSAREAVIFHYDSGHIDDPSYVFSNKDLKYMAVVSSSIGNFDVWPTAGNVVPSPIPSGRSMRVLYVDGGDIGNLDVNTFKASLIQKGQIELSEHNRQVLFDGAISPYSPWKYGKEYFLGDKVTVMAQYGFDLTMMVTEYVRTEDSQGDRGYPALVLSS